MRWEMPGVHRRRMADGKAAELAGMSRLEFIREMGRHGVSPFDFDDDELQEELGG